MISPTLYFTVSSVSVVCMYMSLCLSLCPYLSVCLSIYSLCLSICGSMSLCLRICLSVYLTICVIVCVSICLYVCITDYLVYNIININIIIIIKHISRVFLGGTNVSVDS